MKARCALLQVHLGHGEAEMLDLHGCITAIVTPFDKSLGVDYQGLKENVDFQIENAASGLSPLGTTGEAPAISDRERTEVLRTVVDRANGRVPIIAGTGTNSTERTISYTKEAADLGADAALVVAPYYNRPSQEGIYRHFEAISRATDLPIVVYNIPGRTGVNVEVPTLARMSRLSTIVAVKEASGNIGQIADTIQQLPDGFTVLSGDDGITLPLMALGGKGVISVVSNILPKRISDMVAAMNSGDLAKARTLHRELMPIFRGAFVETNPVPIKTAMELAGMPAGGVRLPLFEMSDERKVELKRTLQKYRELSVSGS